MTGNDREKYVRTNTGKTIRAREGGTLKYPHISETDKCYNNRKQK